MNRIEFLSNRERLEQTKTKYRNLCTTCLQPEFSCYCSHVQKFDPKIKFVILIHPIEAKRRIATGRMSHLCLENSEILIGQDYSKNHRVNELIGDSCFTPLILYPGKKSVNLTELPADQSQIPFFESKKTPVIFVIDGTWATAVKTLRQSKNLHALPQICFTPQTKSQFRVRKQPTPHCLSTIEAIHHTIELVGHHVDFDTNSREHDRLLTVFDYMVERQLEFIRKAYENPQPSMYRRPRTRVV